MGSSASGPQRPPAALPPGEEPVPPEARQDTLAQLDERLGERQRRIASLEAEITTLHQHADTLRGLERHQDLVDRIEAMQRSVEGFRQAAGAHDPAATMDDALRIARHRLARHLSAGALSDLPGAITDAGLTASRHALSDSLGALRQELTTLADAIGEGSVCLRELELAGELQRRLVPPAHHAVPGLELHAWFQPAAQCGGDWWIAQPLSALDGLVVLGDVTGHGLSAAILTGAARGACSVACLGMQDTLTPAQLLRMLNQVLRESARGEFMMTAVALRVRAGGGACGLASAGHPRPLRIREGEITALHGAREPVLGMTHGHAYQQVTFEARPGDLLVAYTDGVTEAEDGAQSQLGDRGLRAVIEAHHGLGPEGLRDAIRDAVLSHRGEAPPRDDACVLVGRIV